MASFAITRIAVSNCERILQWVYKVAEFGFANYFFIC